MRKYLLMALGAAAGIGLLFSFTGGHVAGQSDLECDPFDGNRPAFNLSYWPDTDFCNTTVDLSTIRSGGPPPDGIPPIDQPQYESVESAGEWLQGPSPLIAVTVNGDTRGYPLAILTLHEIVNTEIGGEPTAVTFCPLCNSAIVFDRVVDDQTLRFGVSGNLRNSDLVMWDRQTDSWWQQLTGEGIVGFHAGTQLEILPSQVVGYSQFAEAFPDGQILSRNTSIYGENSYGRNPYANYDSGEPFLFPQSEIDRRLPSTSRVLAGVVGTQPIAYPFSTLAEVSVINDTVDEREIVAFWESGVYSALDDRVIDNSVDVGTAALFNRELSDGTVLTFSTDADGNIVDDQTSSVWNAFGQATTGELEGTQLRQMLGAPHFWFAWAAFQPETAVYGLES